MSEEMLTEEDLQMAMEGERALDEVMAKWAEESPQEERTAQTVALEIRTLQRQAQGIVLAYAIEIGRRLEEAKAMLPHGAWGDWLKRELDYSPSTAQNFMRVFREYGDDQMSLFGGPKSQTFGNITYSKALKLLAIDDEEERERFVSENDVENMSVRELEAAIRERDAARQDAANARMEAQVARNEAESARKDAQEAIAGAGKAMKDLAVREQSYADDVRAAEQAKREAESERDKLRQELEERLTVVDKEAVAKARREAISEMHDNVRKAKEEREKAEAERKAAADALEAMRKELDALKAKAAEPKPAPADDRRVRELEKKLAAANPELSEFKVRYASWQEEFFRIAEILRSIKDPSQAEKLCSAMRAALDQMNQEIKSAAESSGGDDHNSEL